MDMLIKTPKGEMNITYFCEMEYKRINTIMKLIEDEFGESLTISHPELRSFILDISNYIRRLPEMISEVLPDGYTLRLDDN